MKHCVDMKRLFVIVLILVIGVYEANGQKMNRCDIVEFDSFIESVKGQDSLMLYKVPGFLKNKFRKVIMKAAYDKDEKSKETAAKMSDGLEDIVMITYDKCDKEVRDSIEKSLYELIQPEPASYKRDSCYVYGFAKKSDEINVLLMHIAEQSTIIYMKGVFPVTQ